MLAALTLVFVSLVAGIAAGLGIGRFFCKWHHKADATLGLPTPAEDAVTTKYVNELLDSGCCQKRTNSSTIGEEIEGCDRNNCCKDE